VCVSGGGGCVCVWGKGGGVCVGGAVGWCGRGVWWWWCLCVWEGGSAGGRVCVFNLKKLF
jgi:hypothetical protein